MAAWKWIDRLTDAVIMLAPIGRKAAQAIRDRRARKQGRDPLDEPLQSEKEILKRGRR